MYTNHTYFYQLFIWICKGQFASISFPVPSPWWWQWMQSNSCPFEWTLPLLISTHFIHVTVWASNSCVRLHFCHALYNTQTWLQIYMYIYTSTYTIQIIYHILFVTYVSSSEILSILFHHLAITDAEMNRTNGYKWLIWSNNIQQTLQKCHHRGVIPRPRTNLSTTNLPCWCGRRPTIDIILRHPVLSPRRFCISGSKQILKNDGFKEFKEQSASTRTVIPRLFLVPGAPNISFFQCKWPWLIKNSTELAGRLLSYLEFVHSPKLSTGYKTSSTQFTGLGFMPTGLGWQSSLHSMGSKPKNHQVVLPVLHQNVHKNNSCHDPSLGYGQ